VEEPGKEPELVQQEVRVLSAARSSSPLPTGSSAQFVFCAELSARKLQ
jgi:hypothetical protein